MSGLRPPVNDRFWRICAVVEWLGLTQGGGWQRPLLGVLVLSVLSAQTDGPAHRSFFMTCHSGPRPVVRVA